MQPADLNAPRQAAAKSRRPQSVHAGLNARIDRRTAIDFRERCRVGAFTSPTCGQALGFAQANLVVVPQSIAFDFLLFCQRNPKPCPLLDVTEPGDPVPYGIAPTADLRTDLPKYRIYREGKLDTETTNVLKLWRDDLVGFLLGCSFSFESALLEAGLGVRHLEENTDDGQPKNVPMYRTNIACRPAGRFVGPMVVSMRPYSPADAIRAAQVTARFPQVHGSPIHLGDPAAIGIGDLSQPDWGDAVTVQPDEVPVFWACGVTPQAVLMESELEFVITHAPGHMFVTDVRDSELET